MYQTENYTNPIKHEVPLPTEAGLFCENDKTRTMKRIAIQGIKGSYHDMAAHYFFHNEDIELICCSTFEEVFATVKDDSTILGMAAIENTIAGSLLHNYELLCDSGLTIVGEHKLRIPQPALPPRRQSGGHHRGTFPSGSPDAMPRISGPASPSESRGR